MSVARDNRADGSSGRGGKSFIGRVRCCGCNASIRRRYVAPTRSNPLSCIAGKIRNRIAKVALVVRQSSSGWERGYRVALAGAVASHATFGVVSLSAWFARPSLGCSGARASQVQISHAYRCITAGCAAIAVHRIRECPACTLDTFQIDLHAPEKGKQIVTNLQTVG
jgi:hypothetical protein